MLTGLYFTGCALKHQKEGFITDGIILHEGKRFKVVEIKEGE